MAMPHIDDADDPSEYLLGVCLGLLIGLVLVATGETGDQAILYNTLIVGFLVTALAVFKQVHRYRWEAYAEAGCALWLIASPFIFSYEADGRLRHWHFALGAMVLALALLDLWQGGQLSHKAPAGRGR